MTYIYSLRLTGETTETHAWCGGMLCGYVWDAGIAPSGKIAILLTFLSLRVSTSVLDPVDILSLSWGQGREGKQCVHNLRLCRDLPSCLYLANLFLWYDCV